MDCGAFPDVTIHADPSARRQSDLLRPETWNPEVCVHRVRGVRDPEMTEDGALRALLLLPV